MSAMRGDGGPGHGGGFGVGRHHDFGGDDALTRFDSGVVRRLLGFIRPYRRRLAYALLAVALATAVQVSIPLTVRYAVDSAVGHSALPLNVVLAGFGLLIVLNAVLSYLQIPVRETGAEGDLRRPPGDVRPLPDVSLSFMDKPTSGGSWPACRAM